MPEVSVIHGDSREALKDIPDCSVDSGVTDAPYALVSILKRFGKPGSAPAKSGGKTGAYERASAGFMNQRWDTGEAAHSVGFWAEVYRVLKPGAHLVAFSGTRTQHRQVCAIEDAGFEIRDTVLDLIASDTMAMQFFASLEEEQQRAFARVIEEAGVGGMLAWCFGSGFPKSHNQSGEHEGWGSALKPAFEPICLARKPMIGTIAANLAAYGTGALNIEGCRVDSGERWAASGALSGGDTLNAYGDGLNNAGRSPGHASGRWPANVIHDGSAEVVEAFPAEAGAGGRVRGSEPSMAVSATDGIYGTRARVPGAFHGDSGSAARFFYSAKANKFDRFGTRHPTVKPVDLMRWLCRLVTPPGGVILDPFAGSGTTGAAAYLEGFDCILIEREEKYVADIHRRMKWLRGDGRLLVQELETRAPAPSDGPFFSELEGAA